MATQTLVFSGTLTLNSIYYSSIFTSEYVLGFIVKIVNPVGGLTVRVETQAEMSGIFTTIKSASNNTVIFNQLNLYQSNVKFLDSLLRLKLLADVDADVEIYAVYHDSQLIINSGHNLGDFFLTFNTHNTLVEKFNKLWLPISSSVATIIGKSGNTLAFIADDRLRDLYILFRENNLFNILIDQPAASFEEEWDNGGRMVIGTLNKRALGFKNGDMATIEGSEAKTLSIANLPPHDHTIPNQNIWGYSTFTLSQGYGISTNTYAQYTWKSGLTGGNTPFSLVQPTFFGIGTLLVCAGDI